MKKIFCAICCLILISGCSWFADNRIAVKSRVNVDSDEFREFLSVLIEQRYKAIKEIQADLALQQYYLDIKTK